MGTGIPPVVDGNGKLNNEGIGKLQKKINEIARRINQGTISFNNANDVLQRIIEKTLLNIDVTITIPALIKPFIAKDWFKVGPGGQDLPSIVSIGTNFQQWFLAGPGKVEKFKPERTIFRYYLKKPATNDLIIADLNGEAEVEMTLAEVWSFVWNQRYPMYSLPFPWSTSLFFEDVQHVFFVRDVNDILREVCVIRRKSGCDIEAYPIDHLGEHIRDSKIYAPA